MKMKLWFVLCSLMTLVLFIGLSGAQGITAQSETTDLATLRLQFKNELRVVREEMLQQGIAFQEWKIKQLERELQRLTLERGQLEENEQMILRQITEAEKGIEPSEQVEGRALGEQEGLKAELSEGPLQNARAKRKPLIEQEDTLQTELQDERQQLQALLSKLARLKAEARKEQKQ